MLTFRTHHNIAFLVAVICLTGFATSRHLDAIENDHDDDHWHRVIETAQRGTVGPEDELEEPSLLEDDCQDGHGGRRARGRAWGAIIKAILKDAALSSGALKCVYNSVKQIPNIATGEGFNLPNACCKITVAGFIEPFDGLCDKSL